MLIQKQYKKINFTGNLALDPTANTTMFIIIEKSKETVLNFSQGSVKVLYFYFVFNITSIKNDSI